MTKGYFRETCKSQNINPIYLNPKLTLDIIQIITEYITENKFLISQLKHMLWVLKELPQWGIKTYANMGESSKFPKSWTLEIQILKLAGGLQNWMISSLNDWLCSDNLKTNKRRYYYNLPNSAFWGWLSMESQPQNPEFRINPENFNPCAKSYG